MDQSRTCRECQTEIPSETPSGCCPRCLLALGLEAAEGPESLGEREDSPSGGAGGVHRFGDYELQEEIARGGMGIVWRARQISLNRPVALKLILAGQMASEMEIQRFLREAQAAANLDHPNIVPIYEVGEHAGHHYFSMRLIDGGSLAERMADYQWPREAPRSGDPAADKQSLRERKAKALTLIAQTARAVHHAHQRGVLHRDLKPANILIDGRGEPFVTDFGLAKRVDLPGEMSRSDTVVGTPNYMSPEQARGRHQDLTTATDVFSLGAVLYHLLTGRPPFQGPTPWETLRQVVEQEPVRPSVLNREVDPDLETICLKCLEKAPQVRYASAEALAEDLDRWLRQEPIHARPSTELQRAVKWVRRKPRAAALIGLVIVTAVAGLAGVLLEWRQAVVARGEMEHQRGLARAAEQDARERLWYSYLAQARASRWSGRPGRRFDSLAAISNAAAMRFSMPLRNEAIACLGLFDVQERRRWTLPPKRLGFHGVVLDAPFERYACALPNGDVTIRRLRDDGEVLRLPGLGERDLATLCFSADGRFLAEKYEAPKTNFFRVWDLEERKVVIWAPYRISTESLAFGLDSRTVAAAENDGIHLYELPTGRAGNRIPLASAPSSLSFDPTGRRLAVSAGDAGTVEVFDTQSGQRLLALECPRPTWVRWGPDGQLLACSSMDQKIYLWNSFTGKRVAVLAGHHGAVMTLAFNQAGDVLASHSWDGSTRYWDPMTGESRLTNPLDLLAFSAFGPDDQQVAFNEDSDAGLLEVAPGRECRRWPAPPTHCGALDPSGRILIACNLDALRFWDVANRELVGVIPGEGGLSLVLHPDGQSLFVSGAKGLRRLEWALDLPNHEVRVGEIEQWWPTEVSQISLSRDGRTLAAAALAGPRVLLFDVRNPARPKAIETGSDLRSVSLSPDGRWVAGGVSWGTSVKVWDTGSGQLLRELPVAGAGLIGFSPDGHRLITANPAVCQVWETGGWGVVATLPGNHTGGGGCVIAISPAGQTAAVLRGRNSETSLIDLASGRELATLAEGVPLGFSGDGSRLAMCIEDPPNLAVWDLRRIREELAVMKLDWEQPPFPPPAANSGPMQPHLRLITKP